jgi:hypothetical protein
MKLPRTRNSWTERLLIDDAFDAYLEREEHAARVYGRLVSRLEARARERAETRRRSQLRPLLS